MSYEPSLVVPGDLPSLQKFLSEELLQIAAAINNVRSGAWTAAVRGAGTAGTYEIATQKCRYTRIGRRVWLDLYIVFAGTVTGGGTLELLVTGAPFSKAADTVPMGSVSFDGVNWTDGALIALSFRQLGSTSELIFRQSLDTATATGMPISAIGAGDSLFGSICYETDDP